MIVLLVILLLLVLVFVRPIKEHEYTFFDNVAPRLRPVYIDQPTVYFNEDITYSEWPQEPTSSL